MKPLRKFIPEILILLALFVLLESAQAHDYWLEADKNKVEVSGETPVRLFFGENFSRETEKPLQLERTSSFQFLGQSRKAANLLQGASENQKPAAIAKATKDGAMLVAMERSTAEIVFGRKKFLAYANAEGYGISTEEIPEATRSIHEHYTRYLKALVQVGTKLNSAPMKIVGQKYEIVPIHNPFDNTTGKLSFKVLLAGEPCVGARVTAVHRLGSELTSVSTRTNAKGRCSLRISPDGRWLIRSVKIEPDTEKTRDATASYRSYWASLTFGYD